MDPVVPDGSPVNGGQELPPTQRESADPTTLESSLAVSETLQVKKDEDKSEDRLEGPSSQRPIELPSISNFASMKPNTGPMTSAIPGIIKGGPLPQLPPNNQPRPNIIQLPGSMITNKNTQNPIGPPSAPHHHIQMTPGSHPSGSVSSRVISPNPMPFAANPPASQAYGTTGMPPAASQHPHMMMGGAMYHPAPTTHSNQQKMELQDAFAYLDRVKAEFGDQPEVYNRFLQIMREFKANTVVQLFKGHKNLIQGFNAFLPRTHHIDPVVAETGVLPPHLMQIAASMGVPVNSQGVPLSIPQISGPPPPQYGRLGDGPHSATAAGPASMPVPHYPTGAPGGYASQYPQHRVPVHAVRGAPTAAVPPSQAGNISASPIIAGPLPTAKKSSAQFVRAISYVKKIKHRFANEPEIYKTFLAALHSYHREQKTIFEVYMEVANLFNNHPDLLEEFILFLPENEAASITTRLANSSNVPAPTAVTNGSKVERSTAAAFPATKRTAAAPPPASVKVSKRSRQTVPARTAEESAFYERVKGYLGDKQAYAEFLKCLNLFCQDIIKMQDLVNLVHRFIGHNEDLFEWFKKYIGYKDSGHGEGPMWKSSSALVNEAGELNLNACRRIGSYRMYPKSHILPPSSGRSALGREVLNDSLVSCPSFNSEDSTFIASKKNQYEEALFRCEDERFEMDLLIEYNLATIAVFEPLAKKIEAISAEEKSNFTLGPTLGGTSEVIYKKNLYKIYGEKADEIINGLQTNPTVAVPVVLRRLKQKDEEWRRTQRDWNKIWRDIHAKNYYKALDDQGIEFKANDRRTISGRTLINEIETAYQEHRRAIERGDSSPSAHLELAVKNVNNVLPDLLKVLRTSIKYTPALNSNDRKALQRFFGNFLPGFFAQAIAPLSTDQVVAKAAQDISSEQSDGDESTEQLGGSMESRFPEGDTAQFRDLKHSQKPGVGPSGQKVLLFANNNLFVLVRLVQIAFERLEKVRVTSETVKAQPFFAEKKNIVATFLDLHADQDNVGKPFSENFYGTLLSLLRDLVSGSIESGTFEERARFMLGTAAYPIFTFDKLLQAMVKQAQLVLSDPVCEQLIRLFDTWNSRRSAMRLSEYSARLAVENAVPSKENIYRIEFNPTANIITLQLLDRYDESSIGNQIPSEARWSVYVDQFVKLESNPRYWNEKSRVYLKRNRRHESSANQNNLHVHYDLECKIAVNTYKLFFVENTEDVLYRKGWRNTTAGRNQIPTRFEEWINSKTHAMDLS